MTEASRNSIPVGRRIVHVQQSEMSECGLACLTMIANHWGHDFDLASMRGRFGSSQNGMRLRQLMQIADSIGLAPRPLKMPLEDISNLDLPAILHWDMNHYVVVERFHKGRAYIHDPATGAKWHDQKSLSRHYTGVALELRPAPGFEPERDHRKLHLRQLWSRSSGLVRSMMQIVALSLVMQIYALATPYLLQISVDQVLPASDGDLLTVLGVGFLLFGVFAAGAQLLRSYTLLSSGTTLSFGIAANAARRLVRLPTAWFEKRTVGDVLSRFQSVKPIQTLLVEKAPAAIIDGTLAVTTLVLMLIYSPVLTIIPLCGALAYFALRGLTLRSERMTENDHIVANGKQQGTMIETLRGIVTLRLAGRETPRQATWQNRLSEELGARYAHERVRAIQQTGKLFIETVENVVLVWAAMTIVMGGGFSLGMTFAFLAYRLHFANAARNLADAAAELGLIKLHLDRLSDIALTDEDMGFAEPQRPRDDFTGSVEVRDVVHSYGPHDPSVLNGISLKVEQGEHVAITGTSGGGKSTLLRVILGLIVPEGGNVYVDGVPIAQYGRRAYREHVGVVMQDDSLFAGTIADNVAGFDEVDQERLREALSGASVLDDIEKLPLKHLTMVGDMGSTLSGGQRQRVLLARALYRRPRMLVMDEGTSQLDATHERAVNNYISSLGITRIVVAHRRETIEAADRVVRLEGGVIVSDERR